jgi:allophanate hydrolase
MPLVLLSESQTTGGYPKICTIASFDLARLAQMPVGVHFRFSVISRDEGECLWLLQQRKLRSALESLVPKPRDLLNSEYLLSCDLVGGFYDPVEVVRGDTLQGQEAKP